MDIRTVYQKGKKKQMDGFIKRNPGEDTTLETRHDSHETVDKHKRYQQIMEVLSECGPLTAKECADVLFHKGLLPSNERNYAAPRMTELSERGFVEPIGKKPCKWSGKMVAVYAIRKPQ